MVQFGDPGIVERSDVEPYDVEAGLTLTPNAFLERPSVVWCFEWYLAASFPIRR